MRRAGKSCGNQGKKTKRENDEHEVEYDGGDDDDDDNDDDDDAKILETQKSL